MYVYLTDAKPENVEAVKSAGLAVELVGGTVVQGWATGDAIDRLAALDIVREISPPGYALTNQAGSVDTAGNAILRANDARTAFGVTGAGVPVGVMSNGVDHLANSVASGDLPPQGTLLRAGTGDEGTAMLEIVHDIAPGSPLLFFGTAGATSLEMAGGINSLAAAGARVIVDDVVFPDQPKFEDGPIAQAARNFATGGGVYVTSANNYALQHYLATYTPTDFAVTIGARSYARHHNYGNGDVGNNFTVPAGCQVRVFLQWDNPGGLASDDFDLVLVRASDGSVLTASQNVQAGAQRPFEALVWQNTSGTPQTVFVAIPEFRLTNSPSSLFLDYFVIPDCGTARTPFLQYTVPDASVWGQGAVTEVLSVAAVDASTPNQIRPYSARGPGLIIFPLSDIRAVPNITAVDGVQTKVGQLGFFGNPFAGTSAAAPHVAGVAALLLEAMGPSASAALARDILKANSVDLGAGGFDYAFGSGRADAFSAVQFAKGPPANISLAASVLPGSRSVQVGTSATAFATIATSGTGTAIGCTIAPATTVFADFAYKTTDPATNAPIGVFNPPVNIAGGGLQTFIFEFVPLTSFASVDIPLRFDCGNTEPAATVPGVNTFLLSSSTGPAPDIVALAATGPPNNGIVNVPGSGIGAFAVATSNVGAGGLITATADTGSAALPVVLSVCQTNPANAQCINPPTPGTSATVQINPGQTPTFAVFVRATGTVPFDPARNRVFLRFKDGGGITRGSTNVAVRTVTQ